MLPLGSGRFMHLVVLYGYQGADHDPEQLALTEQLFDAALGELSIVARGSALLGCWRLQRGAHQNPLPLAKGISTGLWVDLEEAWVLAAGLRPTPTCKKDWNATGGHRRISWLVALLLLLLFLLVGFRVIGGLLHILLVGPSLIVTDGLPGLLNLLRVLLYGLLLGCLQLIRVGVPSRLRFRGFGRFMMSACSILSRHDALLLDASL